MQIFFIRYRSWTKSIDQMHRKINQTMVGSPSVGKSCHLETVWPKSDIYINIPILKRDSMSHARAAGRVGQDRGLRHLTDRVGSWVGSGPVGVHKINQDCVHWSCPARGSGQRRSLTSLGSGRVGSGYSNLPGLCSAGHARPADQVRSGGIQDLTSRVGPGPVGS